MLYRPSRVSGAVSNHHLTTCDVLPYSIHAIDRLSHDRYHIARFFSFKDARPRNNQVCSCPCACIDGVRLDSAVDLDSDRRKLQTDLRDLWHCPPHERLASETRLNRHHQHMVKLVAEGENVLRRRIWFERYPGLHPFLQDHIDHLTRVLHGLQMESECVCASFGKVRKPLCRIGHHEMAVQACFGVFPHSCDYRGTDGKIWDKVAIHHIHVQPVRP
mmetsp:Transcript_5647/g.7521  ORF Transcript_5647/g.7521 Transcript_5647/m.7521 type:complete len:217 (+) Transcript_5647:205-855(+)